MLVAHRPLRLGRRELRDSGLEPEAVLAVEGPAGLLEDPSYWVDDLERKEVLLRAIRRTEADRSAIGASPHLLAVGRVPRA